MNESSSMTRYRLSVTVLGLGLIALANLVYGLGISDWPGILFFLVLISVSEIVYIPLPAGSLNVTFAALLPVFMLHGALPAATVYVVGTFVGHLVARPRPLSNVLFNSSQLGLSTLAGSGAYMLVTGEGVLLAGPGLTANPFGLAGFIIVFLLVNHVLVHIVIGFQRDGVLLPGRILARAKEPMKWDLLVRALTTPLGITLAWLYTNQGLIGAGILTVPLLCVAYIFRLHLGLSLANRELTILYDVAQRVGSVLEMEKLFDLIAEAVERVAKYDVCSLYLWDEIKQELSLMMIKHPTPDIFEGSSLQIGQGIVGSVVENREPEIIHDAMKDPRVVYHPDDRFPPRSLLVVPLIVEDELVGAVAVGHNSPGAFTTDHLRMLTILGSQAAVAIENAILYRRTEQLAVTDPMTDLYNYRYFYVKLGEELRKARATDGNLSLIYIDLDDFKRYNDTYGHTTGDRILKEFAGILRENLRDSDIPVRYAGDEFVILLSQTSVERAVQVAERIRNAVANHTFWADDGASTVQLTISAGIASFPVHADTEAELIYRADQAMYLAKREGVNHVSVWDPGLNDS